jgi:hypothetical protein|nr:MAG TPA: hypothetical protein [Caudoviricetes sp.]
MAGIERNPYVDSGVLNSEYIRMFPTGTEEDWDGYSKYNIGDIDVASQIVRGTMTFNKEKLRELDPSYTGYTHIFCVSMPEFMKALAQGNIIGGTEDATRKARYHYANLKALLEMGSTSYSGTPDLTLQTADVNVGFAEKNFAVPTYSAYDSTQFSIRCIETYGEPLRHAAEYYISGIADPNAKYQHLHGAAVRTTKQGLVPMQPSLANITFTFLIVQTDQTLHSIQDISIWTNCILTNIERGHLDWELGTIDTVQAQTLQFRGIYLPHSDADAVREEAKAQLEKRLHYYKRLDDMSEKEYGKDRWDNPYAGLPER